MQSSQAFPLLDRFRLSQAGGITLALEPAYFDLLAKFGNPHHHLPPVFHVAGTNGKGSTCAFLRAMLEAQGYKVHVYTSPHLVHYNERIRIAGKLIDDAELAAILDETEKLAIPGKVSFFEATTVAALIAFTRHKADFTILETGLGGRLDATNVVEKPLATLITRLSYDHRDYLGDTIDKIAWEKAGIMRQGVPCFAMAQPDPLALQTLQQAAQEKGAQLFVGGKDWTVEEKAQGFHFHDAARDLDLPQPALLGPHQYQNAALAIAALSVLPQPLSSAAIAEGLRKVEWPARLQKLGIGTLARLLPQGAELWLDGGHNDSAGEILAAQVARWKEQDGANPKPLYVVTGMLTTKYPAEFLGPFAASIKKLRAVTIPDEDLSFTAEDLAIEARKLQISDVKAIADVEVALSDLASGPTPARILICGSLYLAGAVLAIDSKTA